MLTRIRCGLGPVGRKRRIPRGRGIDGSLGAMSVVRERVKTVKGEGASGGSWTKGEMESASPGRNARRRLPRVIASPARFRIVNHGPSSRATIPICQVCSPAKGYQ